MLDGLTDNEIDLYLDEHPKIVPLFEVDDAEDVTLYVMHSEEVLTSRIGRQSGNCGRAEESLEWEMALSQ